MNNKYRYINNKYVPLFNNYIASRDRYVVKYENNTLSLSENNGDTFIKHILAPQFDNIRFCYIFLNSFFMVATHTEIYYTHDWVNLQKSNVYDIDGDRAIIYEHDNFSVVINSLHSQFIDEKEVKVWGNYTISEVGAVRRVWRTDDYGKTIRSVFEFGQSVPKNLDHSLTCRHIHNIDFNSKDNTFWLQTGDEPRDIDSHWIKGVVDDLGVIEWYWIGSGDDYKTTSFIFKNDYIYYTWDVPNGGVMRVKYDEVDKIDNREVVLKTTNDCVGFVIGTKYWIAMQSVYGGNDLPYILFVSTNEGADWVKVIGDMPINLQKNGSHYNTVWAENSKGDILAHIFDFSISNNDDTKTPAVFINRKIDYLLSKGNL